MDLNHPWCTPELIQLLVTPTLRKLDEFWTEGCHAIQIYPATIFLQFEWEAWCSLLLGTHGNGHVLLLHTFVGPAYILCSPYLPVSSAWLAGAFLDDHYFCPTDFYRHREKPKGFVLFVFMIPPRLYSYHHSCLTCLPLPCPHSFPTFHPTCCRGKSTYSSMWVAQSCCLQHKVSQLRCQSAHQKRSREADFRVTQGNLPLSSSLCFQVSLSPFQVPQAMLMTSSPHFIWTYFQTVWLSRENQTLNLMTPLWGTLCFS